MKKLFAITLLVFGLYSCTDSLSDVPVQECGDVRNVAYQSFDYCGNLKTTPTQPVYVLIDSEEEMAKELTTCESFTGTLPDFTKERILALSAGPKPTTGYSIKIQSVLENDCQIAIEYFEKAPQSGDVVTTERFYPIDYVVLPKSDKPLLFIKVNEIADYVIVGSYIEDVSAAQCVGECNLFFKVENYKVLQYLGVNNFPEEFNKKNYKTLVYKDDYASFISKVPTVIKDLKGQTKTFGEPTDPAGGVYFEWSQAGVVTKIFLKNTSEESQEISAFKTEIEAKIAELRTKS